MTKTLRLTLVSTLLLGSIAAGCTLITEVDRTKIPTGTNGGSAGDSGTGGGAAGGGNLGGGGAGGTGNPSTGGNGNMGGGGAGGAS